MAFLATLPVGAVAALATSLGQNGLDVDVSLGPGWGLLGSAVGAFLTTLVIGAILIAVAPDYTRRMMDDLLADPVGSLIAGVLWLVLLVLAVIVLAITLIGIPLAILFAIAAYVVWAIGASIAYLAIGDRLVGHGDGWGLPLLVGAAINGGLTVTGVGGLVSFAIGAAGFGAVLRDWRA